MLHFIQFSFYNDFVDHWKKLHAISKFLMKFKLIIYRLRIKIVICVHFWWVSLHIIQNFSLGFSHMDIISDIVAKEQWCAQIQLTQFLQCFHWLKGSLNPSLTRMHGYLRFWGHTLNISCCYFVLATHRYHKIAKLIWGEWAIC